jgi:hypothetical protein
MSLRGLHYMTAILLEASQDPLNNFLLHVHTRFQFGR